MAKWLSLEDNPLEFNDTVTLTIYNVAMKVESLADYIRSGRVYIFRDGRVYWERYDDVSGGYVEMHYTPTHYILLEN